MSVLDGGCMSTKAPASKRVATDVDLGEFMVSTKPGFLCWRQRAGLTPEQAAKVDAALACKDIVAPTIAKVLQGWGYSISVAQVGNHRRGDCRCD